MQTNCGAFDHTPHAHHLTHVNRHIIILHVCHTRVPLILCTSSCIHSHSQAQDMYTYIIYYTLLCSQQYRTMIYNGDVDGCVPFVGNEVSPRGYLSEST